MKRSFIFLFCILIAGTIYGCSKKQPVVSKSLDDSFRAMIKIEELNNSFQINLDSLTQGEVRFGQDIEISFKNLSERQIVFPGNLGIRLFIIRGNKWVEIINNDNYYGDESLLLPKSQQKPDGGLITWVRPFLPAEITVSESQDILRILVVGELTTNGEKTGVLTGAYTDVLLNP